MGIGEGRRSAHTGDETAVFGNMHVCMEHGHGDVGTASNNFSCDRFGARSPDDREFRDSALALKKLSSDRTPTPVRCTWAKTDGCSAVQ